MSGRRSPSPLQLEIARSVDAPAALLPHLDRLFATLSTLGSSTGQVVRALTRLGLARRHRVLDLACGKGALAVAIAQQLDCPVVGVDAFEPFVNEGRARASKAGVAARCRFESGDARRFRAGRRFDVAMMLGLFGVETAAPLLRRHVHVGGWYVVDDAFRARDANPITPRDRRYALYLDLPTLEQSRAVFKTLNDHVVAEEIAKPSDSRRRNETILRRLTVEARRLERDCPRLRSALREFLHRQKEANRLLDGPIRSALWVVRRGR